jgi:hypothetical protein
MTDIQNFCQRNSVMHNKNQNAISNVFDWQIDIHHVKNSSVGLEIGMYVKPVLQLMSVE